LPGLARAMPALTARGSWYARTQRTRPSSETSPCRKHARPAEHARRDRLGRRQLQVPIGCSKQCTHPRTSIGRHWPDTIVRPGVRVRRDGLLVEESAPSHGSTLTCRGSSDHPEAQIHSRQISGRACGYRSTMGHDRARAPCSSSRVKGCFPLVWQSAFQRCREDDADFESGH
jgi:hypothetical protein